jgi:hypothetical protein
MPLTDPTKLKADLWTMNTVDIRRVGRWLNNGVKRVFDPTQLAKGQHEWVLKTVMNAYSMDDIENAYNYVKASSEKPPIDQVDPTIGDVEIPPVGPNYDTLKPKTSENKSVDVSLEGLTKVIAEVVRQQFNRIGVTQVTQEFSELKRNTGMVIETLTKALADVQDLVLKSNATQLTILFPEDKRLDIGTCHRQQALLTQYLAAGCHVFLTGPAGSGKSTAGELAAKALALTFGATSCCAQDTATKFMGYNDATGTYHTTEFREAYAKGGVFLIDEMDAGNPNVLAVLNSALSNSQCAFPDGMVKRHERFRCIATGNTWGTGKTIQYVGRNAIDAATLNRFVVIYWDYDEALETVITGLPTWSQYVQACRAEIKKRGVNFLITPRASISGAKALRAGIPMEAVLENILFPNLDPDIKRQMPDVPTISI